MSLTVTKILYTVDIVDGSGDTVTVSPITQSVDVASPGPQGATGAQGSAGPQGSAGAQGSAATIAAGSVTTLPAGSAATVTNTGTSGAAVFAFGIPQGLAGSNGSAATISVGTVTTLAAGSPATVTNTGTSSAAVFSFGIPAGSAGAQGSAGTSGVVTVNDPLTNSGTSGSANISIGTAATGGVYGVTTLTDSTSSTSTTTAATPASVKSSYDLAAAAVAADNFHLAQGFTATTIETFARNANLPNTISWTSTGRVYFAIFTPVKNLTIGTASFYCTATPTTTTTARMGLYTWSNATGTATLVARTANDPTLFGTAAVLQSRAFDTAGDYPATYTLTAGSTYAFGMIFVGTGFPTVGALTITNTALAGLTPRTAGQRISQSDLVTIGSLTDTALRIWGRFS